MAVTATVTTNKIDITSTGGVEVTWAECVTAINSVTAGTITIDNTDPDAIIYTITTSTYRLLEISSGCIVRFEEFDELRWEKCTSATYIFTPVTGSEIIVEQGFTFDFGYAGGGAISTAAYDPQRYGYINFQGKTTLDGNSTNHITMKNYRIFYITYALSAGCYMHYVDLRGISYSTHYYLQLSLTYYPIIDNLIDIQYLDITDTRGWGYVLLGNGDQVVYNPDYITLENWTITGINSFRSLCSTFKVKNFIFTDIINTPYTYGASRNSGCPYISTSKSGYITTRDFQPYFMYENCSFIGHSATWCCGTIYFGLAYYKNCTFTNNGASYYGPYAFYGGTILLDASCTFNSMTLVGTISTDGLYLVTREVSITVKDTDNNPIDKATVSITQSEGKEWLSGHTNSDGQLLNIWDNPPVLVEKELISYTGPTYTNWSDSIASGRYHTIVVSKEGYVQQELQVEVTENKTLTFTLEESSVPVKTNTELHGCTLYGSTIY